MWHEGVPLCKTVLLYYILAVIQYRLYQESDQHDGSLTQLHGYLIELIFL